MLSSNSTGPVGQCKRCGKVIEFTSVTSITRGMTNSCMSIGVSNAAEMRESIVRNSSYCKDCTLEVRHAKINRLLTFPGLIYRKFIRSQ